jgi:hypothetical protein
MEYIIRKFYAITIEGKAGFVKSGIKDLADRLEIDEEILLRFILNTPTKNIDLLQSHIKDKDSIKSFILNWEYKEDVLDKEIMRLLEKC